MTVACCCAWFGREIWFGDLCFGRVCMCVSVWLCERCVWICGGYDIAYKTSIACRFCAFERKICVSNSFKALKRFYTFPICCGYVLIGKVVKKTPVFSFGVPFLALFWVLISVRNEGKSASNQVPWAYWLKMIREKGLLVIWKYCCIYCSTPPTRIFIPNAH